MPLDSESVKVAAEAVEAATNGKGKPTEVTLSSGIVLRIKPVPPFLIRKAIAALKRPAVPRIYIEEKEREEENPNDPTYLQLLDEYEARTYDVGANVMLAAGTEVLSIPEGIPGPDDSDWVDLASSLGVELDLNNRHSRYLAWLTLSAIQSVDDLQDTVKAVSGMTGITEEEADEAVASFRNRAQRRANTELPDKAP